MKLFEITLREYIGDKEWTHYELIQARTLSSAEKKADKYAKQFWASYEDDDLVRKNEDGQYEFSGGEIVEVLSVKETTKEKFLEEAYQRALIV
jgi:hypothetical protein